MSDEESQLTIGVIIPAYNAAKYLNNCLISICEQDYQPQQVLIIDDGSTDDTSQIIEKLRTKYPIIKYQRQNNAGQAVARNRGIAELDTDLIAFCDADDYWEPGKLRQQVKVFNDQDVGFCYTNASIVDENGTDLGDFFSIIKPYRGKVYSNILLGSCIPTSSVIIRRGIINSMGGFNNNPSKKYVEDYDFWIRVSKSTKFEYVNQRLVKYMRHRGSSSQATIKSAIAAWRLIANQPAKGLVERIVILTALVRQSLVVTMYLTGLDRLISPLSKRVNQMGQDN